MIVKQLPKKTFSQRVGVSTVAVPLSTSSSTASMPASTQAARTIFDNHIIALERPRFAKQHQARRQ
jgi:hypothetical protein